MEKRYHYFNTFGTFEIDKSIELRVEKSTKKAIKEVLDELSELRKERTNRMVVVAADVVTDFEKLDLLFDYALNAYRTSDTERLFFVMVITGKTVIYNQETVAEFERLVVGGKKESFEYVSNYYKMFSIMNLKTNRLLNDLNRVKEELDTYKSSTKPLVQDIDFEPKAKFHSMNRSLMDIYNSCFDPYMRIMNPGLATNPNPKFQRELVWDTKKKQKLIMSIMNELPIGAIYINVCPYDPEWKLGEGYGEILYDGKQRLHAIDSFLKDEFPVVINGQEIYYTQNPRLFTMALRNANILVYETTFDNIKDVVETYVLINESQEKHTEEDLKAAQEYLQSVSGK